MEVSDIDLCNHRHLRVFRAGFEKLHIQIHRYVANFVAGKDRFLNFLPRFFMTTSVVQAGPKALPLWIYPTTSRPIERAVPDTVLIAAST